MAALPTAPQVSVAVIGFAPHPWKPPGGGCGVFSTLTPSCTTEGETPARPHQAPGSAESLGQGAAAVGSSWWVLGDGGREGGRERSWGEPSRGNTAAVGSRACTWGAPSASPPGQGAPGSAPSPARLSKASRSLLLFPVLIPFNSRKCQIRSLKPEGWIWE